MQSNAFAHKLGIQNPIKRNDHNDTNKTTEKNVHNSNNNNSIINNNDGVQAIHKTNNNSSIKNNIITDNYKKLPIKRYVAVCILTIPVVLIPISRDIQGL